jgi:hypothetical protein
MVDNLPYSGTLLFVVQRLHGIDARGAARRHIVRDQGYRQKQRGHARHYRRIERRHAEEQRAQGRRQHGRACGFAPAAPVR